MNCVDVRERLAEHTVAALSARDSASVERHLAWCAACRKEAGELQRASATLAFALGPEPVPAGLEDRVVEAVQGAVARRDRRPQASPRRSRLVLVAALTAVLAVLGTGWGAVMAGRAARSDDLALREKIRKDSAVERFQEMLSQIEFGDNEGEVLIGTLDPVTPGAGAGNAFTMVSPSTLDLAVVMIQNLPDASRELLPMTVRLNDGDEMLMVGRIEKNDLDDGGAGTVMAEFHDLSGYDTVIVRDSLGRVVMRGAMAIRAVVESPTP